MIFQHHHANPHLLLRYPSSLIWEYQRIEKWAIQQLNSRGVFCKEGPMPRHTSVQILWLMGVHWLLVLGLGTRAGPAFSEHHTSKELVVWTDIWINPQIKSIIFTSHTFILTGMFNYFTVFIFDEDSLYICAILVISLLQNTKHVIMNHVIMNDDL